MMIHDELGLFLKLPCEVIIGKYVNTWGLKFVFDARVISYYGKVSF